MGDILSVGGRGIRFQKRIRGVLTLLCLGPATYTMASYSIAPATMTSFLPLLSVSRQNQIIRMDTSCTRAKSRHATEDALLEDIHKAVREQEIVDVLMEKIRDPYKDAVTASIFRARKDDSIQVTGYDHAFAFKTLLVSWGKIVQSLNDGLGENFRVYPEDDGAEIVLYLEFRPKPVMNPEDEEYIDVPMRPRTSSIESE